MLGDEKLKADLRRNPTAIIVIDAVVTGLGALACLMTVRLTCAADNRTRYATFSSPSRETSVSTNSMQLEGPSFVTFAACPLGIMLRIINNDEAEKSIDERRRADPESTLVAISELSSNSLPRARCRSLVGLRRVRFLGCRGWLVTQEN